MFLADEDNNSIPTDNFFLEREITQVLEPMPWVHFEKPWFGVKLVKSKHLKGGSRELHNLLQPPSKTTLFGPDIHKLVF